jgi:hypothetical protein
MWHGSRDQGSQFRGKPVGYRGNRPYRCGSVGVTDRFFDKTEPTKSAYSVNRSKTSVNRSGFVGFENRYYSGFLNHGRDLPSSRLGAGSWRRALPPCRQKRYPAAVPHGGMDLTPWGMAAGPAAVRYGARCIFLEFFDSTIYFSKIKAK